MFIVITGLNKYTKYSITVKAFNNIGTGPKIIPEVVATTDEDGKVINSDNNISMSPLCPVPSAPPGSVSCSGASSTSLLLSWTPPDEQFMNGDLQGFFVYFRAMREWEGRLINTRSYLSHIFPSWSNHQKDSISP